MREGRSRAALRRLTPLALGFWLQALVGCKGSRPEASVAPLPPAPAPVDLVAEGAMATPDATWRKLQRGLGGAAGLLPQTLGGLITAATGLDDRLGAEVNGGAPAFFVVARGVATPSWVLAVRLVDERRARPLFEGVGAPLAASDGGAGLTRVSGARPLQRGIVAAVGAGGWLVLASSAAALDDLGPYATRALSVKAWPGESIAIDVPASAVGGQLAPAADAAWAETKQRLQHDDAAERGAHAGRAPDFGDPGAVVAALDGWVGAKLGVVRDLAGAHVAIDVPDDQSVSATFTSSPATPAGPARAMVAALPEGDASPLATLPSSTALALLTRDDAASRTRDAHSLESALASTLGPRLATPDANKVHAAMDDWTASRGDWMTLALVVPAADRAVIADVASSDPPRAAHALREGLDLVTHVPALREPLEAWTGMHGLTLGAADAPDGLPATTASFTSGAPLQLAWAPAKADVRLALGSAPVPLLAAPQPGAALGDDPSMHALLASLGDVSVALIAQASRIPGCTGAGGIALAWGTRKDAKEQPGLWAKASASDPSLRCLAKSFF